MKLQRKLARTRMLEKKDATGECYECKRPARKGRNLCEYHGTRRTTHTGIYNCGVCGQSGHNRQRCPTREK